MQILAKDQVDAFGQRHIGYDVLETFAVMHPDTKRRGVAPCRKPRDCGEHSIPVHPIECTLRITPARAGKASRPGESRSNPRAERPSPRAGTTADRNGGLRSIIVKDEHIETVFPGIRRDLDRPTTVVSV